MLGGFAQPRLFVPPLVGPPAPPLPQYYTGLDLGQMADPSAIVVVEKNVVPDATPDDPDRTRTTFDIRHIDRWPLRTPYPKIVADVKAMFATGVLSGTTLVIDQTGVGRPVVDMFREATISAKLRPYSITAGRAQTADTVAKVHLVAAVQAPLSSRRIRSSDKLALTPTLMTELENFHVTVDEQTRNESFAAWRNADHDDIVLALALVLYVASQPAAFVMNLSLRM